MITLEKAPHLAPSQDNSIYGKIRRNFVHLAIGTIIAYTLLLCLIPGKHAFKTEDNSSNPDSLCPIVEKIDPFKHVEKSDTVDKILHDEAFRNLSISKLLGAVRYPTQGYDDMVNPNVAETLEELFEIDSRWEEIYKFHEYLEKTFPLVHKHLKLDKVNKLGLVYTWEGSNTELKPLFLTAHFDVVPIQKETLPKWTFPPFEGGYKDGFLYGRGVSDCKDLLVALMETVELLLSEGKFSPSRTIILGFGYDEESHGTGAQEINKHLVAKYGKDSIFQIIDEGDLGYERVAGTNYIVPATGEKGHLDSIIELYTPGGHSSIPPPHTSIGLLSKLVSLIEDQEFAPIITNSNPVLNQLQCVAEHSKEIDPEYRDIILKAHLDKHANTRLLDIFTQELSQKYLVTTSQAVDIIQGGVKLNALPEHVSVLINHRIAIEESVDSTAHKVLGQIVQFAKKYELGVVFDGKTVIEPTEKGYFNYSLSEPLEPAPLTPIGDGIWNLFGGSLRYLYEDLMFPDLNETFIMAPFISTGNTDTRMYWDLTRNIYRYAPGIPAETHIHSVDERLVFDGHLLIIAFYYYYLQLADKFDEASGAILA